MQRQVKITGMTFNEFKQSVSQAQPPGGLNIYLQAMWYDAKGDWHKAHALVDHLDDETACRVHAYLHRKEGDQWNAGYWYKRAGAKQPSVSLDEEWEMVTQAFL